MLQFVIDTLSEKKPFVHYWEKCVGSCHAYTALRRDYQEHLEKVHRECGFHYVRFHGLLDDDMSVAVRDHDSGEVRYCYFNLDTVFDFLLRIGMKPFIELGFMPSALASSGATCFHYGGNISPPADFDEWDALIKDLVAHLIDRYGVPEVRSWFFEVWNEPNLSYFFEGDQSDYFALYEHTAKAIKEVEPGLSVGGPATALNAWIPQFTAYCRDNSVPLDFISTHHYPSDDPLWRDDSLGMEDLLKIVKEDGRVHYKRGVLKEMAGRAKREAAGYPLYYTEWNSSAMIPDVLHDAPYNAALVAKTIIDNQGLVDAYSFWTFTDIFEEKGQLAGEFHGGFGLQTVHGIPKPVYHAFYFLHKLGTVQLSVSEEQETVGMIATEQNDEIIIVAYNHHVIDMPIEIQDISLTVLHRLYGGAELLLADETHGNAYHAWNEMGSPRYPRDAEIREMLKAAQVAPVPLATMGQNGNTAVSFSLPPHSVALVRFHTKVR